MGLRPPSRSLHLPASPVLSLSSPCRLPLLGPGCCCNADLKQVNLMTMKDFHGWDGVDVKS